MFLKLFYFFKPLIPRGLQIALRRRRASRIFSKETEPYIPTTRAGKCAQSYTKEHIPVLLTHDVETIHGIEKIDSLLEIEHEYNVKSTWNFVLDKYGDVSKPIEKLRHRGNECGAHGLFHDGRLFSSRDEFRRRFERIIALAERYELTGFRSPSLLRNEDYLREVDYFSWDSSIPAWDPFQPHPGGCLLYHPFMLNDYTVELPVTLWQDFTLFHELDQNSAHVWIAQATEIVKMGGLINIIVHPDYFDPNIASAYEDFLQCLIQHPEIEITLPSLLAEKHRKLMNNEQKVLG